jgi:chromosome partitioning protein
MNQGIDDEINGNGVRQPIKPQGVVDELPNAQAMSRNRDPSAMLPDEQTDGTKPKKSQTGPLVIAIANQKGGVAKTTTAVSLGGALVRHNQEVLLVDLDAQANLTLALGKDPSRVRGAVTEVLFNSASLLSVSRETNIPGLDLVPANAEMDLAERFLPIRKDYETILRRALQSELRPASKTAPGSPSAPAAYTSGPIPRPPTIHYDYVLLDCPPFLGAVTLNALVAADLLIIPTQPEFFSANALRTMTAAIRQVRNQHNPDLIYKILITIFDRRNRIHREVSEQIRSAFGEGVFSTVIEVDTKLRESAVEGTPISHRKTQSRSAVQYNLLAEELMAHA